MVRVKERLARYHWALQGNMSRITHGEMEVWEMNNDTTTSRHQPFWFESHHKKCHLVGSSLDHFFQVHLSYRGSEWSHFTVLWRSQNCHLSFIIIASLSSSLFYSFLFRDYNIGFSFPNPSQQTTFWTVCRSKKTKNQQWF